MGSVGAPPSSTGGQQLQPQTQVSPESRPPGPGQGSGMVMKDGDAMMQPAPMVVDYVPSGPSMPPILSRYPM